MEPPPPPSLPGLSSATASTIPTTAVPPVSATSALPHGVNSYPDSVDSSPRSRTTDGWDDLPAQSGAGGGVSSKLRLMCSYGGHIVPRPHDKSLCYIGGDTRIVVVDRNNSLSALTNRLSNTLLNGRPFTLKYQLPSEDLDSLISVTTDEDLDNMIDEYDRTISSSNSGKPSRLRLFLFPSKPESTQSMGQILESSAKNEDWFLNFLNNPGLLNRGFSDSDTNVNRLLGLDDGLGLRSNGGGNGGNLDLGTRDGDASLKSAKQQQHPPPTQQGGQDVHSVPDSPMLDTTSSFGSTSSSPSLANLPPIRVHVEESGGIRTMQDQKLGIEDQFAQFNVAGGVHKQPQQQQQDEAFAAISSPPPPMVSTNAIPVAPVGAVAISGDYNARVYSDDERSDHGMPVGYRKPPTPHSQPQNLTAPQVHQQKSNGGGHELPSPDSVSSDSSMGNPLSRQKPSIYQDPIAQVPSGAAMVAGNPIDPKTIPSDPNTRVQIQDSGYILQTQFEQQLAQSQPHQQQQQFMHAASQYIHHHPAGAVPIQAYYPIFPSQHRHPGQLDQQPYPLYYVTGPVPTRQPQVYNMPLQQSGSVSDAPGSIAASRPQTQPKPNPTMMAAPPGTGAAYNPMRNVPVSKPEMGSGGGVYPTTPALGGAQLVQAPTSQHQHHQQPQFVGYSQVHHPPPQSVVAPPGSAGNSNYGYEFADPAHAPIFFTQPLAHAQYQTMTGMVLPDGSTAQLPTENLKQQIRSSQPL